MKRPIRNLFAAFCLIAGIVCFGNGIYSGIIQHQTITSGVPVEALIVESNVRQSRTRYRSSIEPRVTFRYEFEGKSYSFDGPALTATSRSKDWAENIVKQYPVDSKATAYVNPHSPANACLIKEYGSGPYDVCFIGILFFLSGWALHSGSRPIARVDELTSHCDDGWYQLTSPSDRQQASRSAIIVGVAWTLIGLPVWALYQWLCVPPGSLPLMGCVIAFIATGCAIVIYGAYNYSVANKYGEAEVFIRISKPSVGNSLGIKVEQSVRSAGVLDGQTVTIACVASRRVLTKGTSKDVENRCFEESQTALRGHGVKPDERLSTTFKFRIPLDAPPTSPPDSKGRTRFKWWIEVKTVLRNRIAYRHKWAIEVRQAVS